MKKLSQIIREFGDTQATLAHVLGVTESTLSWKLNGKAEFKQSEIKAIAERYTLSPEDVQSLFFE